MKHYPSKAIRREIEDMEALKMIEIVGRVGDESERAPTGWLRDCLDVLSGFPEKPLTDFYEEEAQIGGAGGNSEKPEGHTGNDDAGECWATWSGLNGGEVDGTSAVLAIAVGAEGTSLFIAGSQGPVEGTSE